MRPSGFPPLATRIQTIRIIEWTTRARGQLAGCSETPGLDAELLAARVKNRDRTWVLSHPEHWIEPSEERDLQVFLNRRLSGEPLPYILGEWEFFGRKFLVNPSVLIPRPETEILVETALDWLSCHPGARKVLDVGTGSGIIAISLASSALNLEVAASDISIEAIAVAESNAERNDLSGKISFLESDLLTNVPGSFDLICANLPYIPSELLRKTPNLSFEPASALDGGMDGLDVIRRLLKQLPGKLNHPSLVLLEIQADQGETVSKAVVDIFPEAKIQILPDLAGLPRVVWMEFE